MPTKTRALSPGCRLRARITKYGTQGCRLRAGLRALGPKYGRVFKWSPHGLCARARGFACGTRARGTCECALPRHCGCWSLSGQVGQQCRTAGRSSCPGRRFSIRGCGGGAGSLRRSRFLHASPLLLPLPWRASRAGGGRCRWQLVVVVDLAVCGSELMPRSKRQTLPDRCDPNRM